MVAMRRTDSKIKILVLHNGTGRGAAHAERSAPERAADLDPELGLAHLRGLVDGLSEGGFQAAVVDAEDDTQRITHAVVVEQPALVFLVDHFHGETLRHPNVASLLELHGLIYTGSDPLCLSTCRDRVRTYLLLSDAEVPVPGHAVVRDINAIPDTDELAAPLVVSHALDDVIDDPDARELARSRGEVEDRARALAAGVGLPLLIEELIAGRRIQAVVLGNRVLEVLPLTERSPDASGRLGPAAIAQLDVDTADSIRALAQRAFRVMGCRDCAQIDFALDGAGRPHVINVHALFDMFPDSPFVVGARASELGFAGAVAHLAGIALDRAEPQAEPAPPPLALPEPDPEPAEAMEVEPEPELQPPAAEAMAAEPRRPRVPTPRRTPASRRPRTGEPIGPPPSPRPKAPKAKAKAPGKKKSPKKAPAKKTPAARKKTKK